METIISISAFVVLGLLWVAFAYALIASQSSLDAAWKWIRDLPIALQVVVWLLFLPVVLGLWVWEMAWPIAVRLVIVAGLAWATLWAFFPKFVFTR